MKKAMWIISLLSLILTAVALQYMPDSVPMHYNFAGEIDRWGSKYENLLFPVITIAMSLFWHLFISYFQKKLTNAASEKERAEIAANIKVLKVAGVLMAALFTAMQASVLYGAYTTATSATTQASIDILKVTCVLLGIMIVVLGNIMPKTRMNSFVGVRVSWSMYNDITWMKSNRFGAVAMMAAGCLTSVTALFANSVFAMVMVFVYLLAATVITLMYSHKIYKEELAKDGHR